jgi:ribosomal protein S18 acetylase RimI-like enzyme
MSGTWYHGSPYPLTRLREGSTITRDRDLAEVFSHKPTIVSAGDDGTLRHNGTRAGFLYRVAEDVGQGDVYPHPRSSMEPGKEWLTRRALQVELIGPTHIVKAERLTEAEIAALKRQHPDAADTVERGMVIERAAVRDAGEILDLQRAAYRSEAAIYDDDTIPPLTQTLEEMQVDIQQKVVLKVAIDDKIVGSVRAYQEGDTCYVGRLIVDPDFQNRGIGTRLMHEIEGLFDRAHRFELFTGHKSERNLHLYRKLGYRVCRQQRLSDAVNLVFLEKRR